MKSEEIKNLFIDFFKRNNHIELEEYSLIPFNDKSLLFTNSGMVQFKNIFLGIDEPLYDKVVTSQRCVRLGGKHNDLDSIGESRHHNTSFEMLGNFSFKNTCEIDTIKLCWKFLVDILCLDVNKLYVTIHANDVKLKNIWSNCIGLSEDKILFGSDDTNFWSMDENGPCGYCTEIFYNLNDKFSMSNLLEIWNIVFIQFNKQGSELRKLQNIYVDTGMGLERITSVIQGHYDNFKVDSYKLLLDLTRSKVSANLNFDIEKSVKIIIDHLKTAIFLLKEGLIPSNDGRGYVLKKLIRRAVLKKIDLKFSDDLYLLVDDYIKILDKKNCYSDNDVKFIKEILKYEEMKFSKTLKNGVTFLKSIISSGNDVNGKVLFNLYDTYGLPLDYIKEILFCYNMEPDIDGFNSEMRKQINNSKKIFKTDSILLGSSKTVFTGYEEFNTETYILKIIKNGILCERILSGEEGILILPKTSFYAEKGGQIGDIGFINNDVGSFSVFDTKENNGIFFHYGKMVYGSFELLDSVVSRIDLKHRSSCASNHSSTHLLHAVLKKTLGNHIKQAGSFICSTYLRFDFTHFSALSSTDIFDIEKCVNDYVLSNLDVKTFINFDKVSGKDVRTVVIGDCVSEELCAGTHVLSTGKIGLFKILKDIGIGNNVRRIEAISGVTILELLESNEKFLTSLTKKLKSTRDTLHVSVDKLIEKNKVFEKALGSFYLKDLLNSCLSADNFIFFGKTKLITLFRDKNYLIYISNLICSLTNSILLFYYGDHEKFRLNIYISTDVKHISVIDLVSYLEKNTYFKGCGRGTTASGIILSCEDVSKCIHFYLKNNMKGEENNVNFN